jgi:hypothetical protein
MAVAARTYRGDIQDLEHHIVGRREIDFTLRSGLS